MCGLTEEGEGDCSLHESNSAVLESKQLSLSSLVTNNSCTQASELLEVPQISSLAWSDNVYRAEAVCILGIYSESPSYRSIN